MNRFYKKYIVPPDTRVSLAKYDPDDTLDFKDKEAGLELLAANNRRIARLQNDLLSLIHISEPTRH